MVPWLGRYTPLITFSIELLPAPFGPMIARISCSRTSKLTSVSAFTPPKASEMPSAASTTPPILRPTASATRASSRFMRRPASCGAPRAVGREGLRRDQLQVRADGAGAPVLEAHLRLDVAALDARVQRLHDRRVLLADEAAAHLARAGELAIVGVELLVQDHEAVDLAAAQLRVGGQVGVHLFHAVAHQLAYLRLGGEVGVAGVRNAAALRPVAHGLHVDVDHRGRLPALVAEGDRFLHVGEELELVLEVLRREERAVGEAPDVLR